jgi:hypothetical protein
LAESEAAAAKAAYADSAKLWKEYKETWLFWCNTSDALSELMEATDNILRSLRRQPSQQLLMATAEIMARSRALTIPDSACRPAIDASEPCSVAPELYGHATMEAAASRAASEAASALAASEVTATYTDYVIELPPTRRGVFVGGFQVWPGEPKPRGASSSGSAHRKSKNKNLK